MQVTCSPESQPSPLQGPDPNSRVRVAKFKLRPRKLEGMGVMAETPKVAGLGHVGLHCFNVDRPLNFYTQVLGLVAHYRNFDTYFLSTGPDTEHHELLLTSGRSMEKDQRLIQQLSFRCSTFEDVLGFYRRLESNGTVLDKVVSHGNTISVYFFDPEGNRLEVYWQTGVETKQLFEHSIDIESNAEVLTDTIRDSVRMKSEGTTKSAY